MAEAEATLHDAATAALDLTGLRCPTPIVRLNAAFKELPVGACLAVRATDRDGVRLQRVLVGPVDDAPQLDGLVARLQDAGYGDARLAID